MIKIIHYIPGFSYGGIETMILNLHKNINKNKMQFTFLVETNVPDYAKKIIKDNNGIIIQIPKMTNFIKIFNYIFLLFKIFKNGKYDVFHCHSLDTRPFPMLIARIFRIKMRILHIHFNDYNNKKLLFLKKLFVHIGQKNANYFISCSKRAANSILNSENSKKALILNNGIEVNKYKFNLKSRNFLRKRLNFSDNTFLIGCIGRLSYLKNQQFIVDFANELPKNYYIIFLGDGEDKKKLMNEITNKNLNNIKFMGNVDNVKEYMNAFDLVLMPSISEAMPLTIIEIQANGIPAIVSNAIDKEFIINSNIMRLNLDKDLWKDSICTNNLKRIKTNESLDNFNIKKITILYEKTIIDFLTKKEKG